MAPVRVFIYNDYIFGLNAGDILPRLDYVSLVGAY